MKAHSQNSFFLKEWLNWKDKTILSIFKWSSHQRNQQVLALLP
jgi:ABC-type uncharacterized transport system involved in gliding motility auxiliary subunit